MASECSSWTTSAQSFVQISATTSTLTFEVVGGTFPRTFTHHSFEAAGGGGAQMTSQRTRG